MVFLQLSDVLRHITQEALDQITNADNTILDRWEPDAISTIKSYLSGRYVGKQIFYPLGTYDATKSYKYYERVLSGGNLYYATPPADYNPTTNSLLNSLVTFDQRVYQNQIPTYNGYAPPPTANYWNDVTETAIAFAAGTPLSDTTKWTLGDGRNQLIVNHCISIMLYKMHAPISYHNTPLDVEKRYLDAISWLKDVSSGTINGDLPEIGPTQGVSISWQSSQPKFNHYY